MFKETRKKISMIGVVFLVVVGIYTMIVQVDVPPITAIIINAFIAWIAYNFGKSTAQDHLKDYSNTDITETINRD